MTELHNNTKWMGFCEESELIFLDTLGGVVEFSSLSEDI